MEKAIGPVSYRTRTPNGQVHRRHVDQLLGQEAAAPFAATSFLPGLDALDTTPLGGRRVPNPEPNPDTQPQLAAEPFPAAIGVSPPQAQGLPPETIQAPPSPRPVGLRRPPQCYGESIM